MRRRQILRGAVLLGTLGLAGCTGGGSTGPGGRTTEPTPDDEPSTPDPTTETGTDTDTPTPTEERTQPTVGEGETDSTSPGGGGSATPRQVDRTTDGTPTVPDAVTDYSFDVTGSSGGGQVDSATVSFDEGDERVAVSGTIWGNDACQTAALDGIELADGELTVRVREATRREDGVCAQVIVETDYEATVTLETLPETVTVTHDHGDGHREVTSTRR